MNQRIEKTAFALINNRNAEGTELWVSLYDILFDYRALLLDHGVLQKSVGAVLAAYNPGKHYDAVELAAAVARLRLAAEIG